MRPVDSRNQRFELIPLLWGLLFTKCFTLEYLVREYAVPINSFVYVWMLSIFMATVATLVYGQLERSSLGQYLQSPESYLKIITFGVSAACVLWMFAENDMESSLPLTLLALSQGLNRLMTKGHLSRPQRILFTAAWTLSGAIIFTVPPSTAFSVIGMSLLILCVIPRTLDLFKKKEK